MRGTEIARILRKPPSSVSGWVRQGRFKNAVKVLVDHKMVWEIDDAEVEIFLKNYKNNHKK